MTELPPNEKKEVSRSNRMTGPAIGILLIVFGGLLLFNQWFGAGDTIAMTILFGFSAVFLTVFVTGRQRWWALIPAYVFGVVALFLGVERSLHGEGDAIYFLTAIALPFLVVFIRKPSRNWWALIPAYVMGTVSAFLMVEQWLPGDWDAIFWLFAIALPFVIVYFTNPKRRWWALIPAGIMGTIGIGLLISQAEILAAVALIVAGGFLLLKQLGGARVARPAEPRVETPLTGPEADKPAAEFEPLGSKEGE